MIVNIVIKIFKNFIFLKLVKVIYVFFFNLFRYIEIFYIMIYNCDYRYGSRIVEIVGFFWKVEEGFFFNGLI